MIRKKDDVASEEGSSPLLTSSSRSNLIQLSTLTTSENTSSTDAGHFATPTMSARTLALHLLQLVECPSCYQPVREPITLPCGHTSCLACIMQKVGSIDQASQSSLDLTTGNSHLPPRLPLASTVVPCPFIDCARSAIGQGIGSWKGFSATYGATDAEVSQSHSILVDDTARVGAGQLPLDGFVVPTNQDSTSLGVIRPQTRQSYLTKYAVSKFGSEGQLIAKETSLLRSDVTLSKAIDALRRFANLPDLITPSISSTQSRIYSRGTGRERRRNRAGRANRSRNSIRLAQDDTRTQIDERFLPLIGASEDGVEPGTVGGVSAVVEDNTDEDEDEYGSESDDSKREVDFNPNASIHVDEDDEEIGGAFARHSESHQRDKRVRRYTLQKQTISLSTQLNYPGSLAKTIQEALLDDEEALDQPFSSRQIILDSLHKEMMDILECQLCYMLLYQPLTTPCGHTFCRRCFARSLDHSTSCPLCRAEMPPFSFFQEHPCNSMIVKFLTATVKRKEVAESYGNEKKEVNKNLWGLTELYKERQNAIEKEERESLLSTPIFVCTLGFPSMPTILHIFEPRYRLMIRRCLESGHPRFGMVLHSQDMSSTIPGMSPYGTMLEIKTVKMLPDGRSMIETVGSHRFRVMEKGNLDGYTVGRIERIDDVQPEAEYELEQASMGNFDLWTEYDRSSSLQSSSEGETSASHCRNGSGDSRGDSSDDSSSSLTPSSTLSMTLAEAQDAHAAFKAALGLDSLDRRGGDNEQDQSRRQRSSEIAPSFVQRSSVELISVCNAFIETLRSGSAPWLMTRLNDTYGPMPDPSNIATFGYWMALVMPIDEHEKAKLLPIRSARLRLCIVVHWIEQLRQTWWFNHGCSVQ